MRADKNPLLIPIFLVGAIIVVALNGYLALAAIHSLQKNQGWVDHTYAVINELEALLGAEKDIELGARGYLITGDKNFLVPYDKACASLPGQIDHIGSLTSDNLSQRPRVAYLRQVIQDRIKLLRMGVQLREKTDTDAVREIVMGGTGGWALDALRASADDMEAEERRLLAERNITVTRDFRRTRMAVVLASALDILLIGLMFRYFIRERGLRMATEIANVRLEAARHETERKSEEVRLLNSTLERRVQQRTADLEAVNRELEAFSYSVSHDLRAPLRTIDGFSLALEEDYAEAVDDMGRDYIRRVRTGVQRMGALIDALLQLSRVTRAEIERVDVDVSGIADSVATALREQNSGSNVILNIEPGLHAEGDQGLIRVALENLLGNAVKFSAKKSDPVISFGFDKEKSAFFVRDNGAGFDMHYADKLFGAFNRLHGDKDFKGSGIGLATVARVVRRHHGKIWADSVENEGAVFWFTLG